MVTTNSEAAPLFGCDGRTLSVSELPGDKELYYQVEATLAELIKQIKPILVYIEQFIGTTRGVVLLKHTDGTRLAINRQGQWILITDSETRLDERAWVDFDIDGIIQAFHKQLTLAMDKKTEHLVILQRRKEGLERAMAAMKGEAVPALPPAN